MGAGVPILDDVMNCLFFLFFVPSRMARKTTPSAIARIIQSRVGSPSIVPPSAPAVDAFTVTWEVLLLPLWPVSPE